MMVEATYLYVYYYSRGACCETGELGGRRVDGLVQPDLRASSSSVGELYELSWSSMASLALRGEVPLVTWGFGIAVLQ